MAERERIPLGEGVALYRQYEAWILEVCCDGGRLRKSLTRDRIEALKTAVEVMSDLKKGDRSIAHAQKVIKTAAGLLRAGLDQPPDSEVEEIKDKLPALIQNASEVLALKAAHVQNLDEIVKNAVRAENLEEKLKSAVRSEMRKPEAKPAHPQQVLDEYEASLVDEGLDEDHIGIVVSIIKHFLDEAKVKSLADLTEDHVRNHKRSLTSVLGNGDATVKKKIKRIVYFLNFAMAPTRGYVLENVAAGIKLRKVEAPDNDCYTKEELEALFRKVKGHGIENVVLMAFWTGLDRMDLEVLEGADINRTNRRITGRRHKTNKRRRDGVPIFDAILEVVKTLPREGRVFGHWKNLQSVGTQANAMGINFRKLRRSFVTHLRLSGVLPDVVARWACHTETVEDKHYVCATDQPMIFTYHGLPLVPHGLPEIPKTQFRKVDDPG